eukprot:scaffold12765_cov101-Isochrysis_galbana.AAC.1
MCTGGDNRGRQSRLPHEREVIKSGFSGKAGHCAVSRCADHHPVAGAGHGDGIPKVQALGGVQKRGAKRAPLVAAQLEGARGPRVGPLHIFIGRADGHASPVVVERHRPTKLGIRFGEAVQRLAEGLPVAAVVALEHADLPRLLRHCIASRRPDRADGARVVQGDAPADLVIRRGAPQGDHKGKLVVCLLVNTTGPRVPKLLAALRCADATGAPVLAQGHAEAELVAPGSADQDAPDTDPDAAAELEYRRLTGI